MSREREKFHERTAKNSREREKKKPSVTEMKDAFDGLISTKDAVKERLSKLGDISTETLKIKKQRK